jgi:broad specificity phosphatase PhoE
MPLHSSVPDARTLWLVRHGESTWNTLGLAQGHNDQAELTIRGLHQAAEVARQFAGLPVHAIYASDLRRAQQTAGAVAATVGVAVLLDTRLRERSLGALEGRPAAGNSPSETGLDLVAGRIIDPDARPPGGESVRDLYRRAAAFCDDLVSGGVSVPGDGTGDVVAVAHGGTLRVLRAYLSGAGVEEMDWAPLANATVLRFPLRSKEEIG